MNENASIAVLLIAHGSRRAAANDDLVQLAAQVRARAMYPIVEIAYLELAEPTIPAGAKACVDRGADRVLMMPYFLSPGRHVREDLQRFRDEFTAAYPGVEFDVCEPLGLHPKLIDVVLERVHETSTRQSREAEEE